VIEGTCFALFVSAAAILALTPGQGMQLIELAYPRVLTVAASVSRFYLA
jgi:hypothetical protein